MILIMESGANLLDEETRIVCSQTDDAAVAEWLSTGNPLPDTGFDVFHVDDTPLRRIRPRIQIDEIAPMIEAG